MRDDADEDSVVVEEDPPDSFGLGVRLPPVPTAPAAAAAAPTMLFVDDCS